MPSLHSVSLTPDLGPLYDRRKEKRQTHCHTLGNTPSLTDSIVQDSTLALKINFTDHIHPTRATVTNKNTLIETYRPQIKGHIEGRVNAFFQQAIALYGTKLRVESEGASDQGASAPCFYLKTTLHPQEKIVRQAAHSSTNPRLIAYIPGQPEGRVFLYGTDYYKMQNATRSLPRWVNDADREIDEKTAYSKLRQKSTALLNRVSQEETTPHEALVEFVDLALEEVDAAKTRLQNANKDPEVRQVLLLYHHYLSKYKDSFEFDYTLIDQLLGITIEDEDYREQILKTHYTLVRNAQLKQARLAQKVDAIRKDILDSFSRKPPQFEAAFLTLAIESGQTSADKKQLSKFFSFSPTNFTAQLSQKSITLLSQTKTKLAPHAAKIKKLTKELLEKMKTFYAEELRERGEILRDFRLAEGLTQTRLAAKVRKKGLSRTTLSSIENGHTLLLDADAKRISKALKIPLTLFVTELFYYP